MRCNHARRRRTKRWRKRRLNRHSRKTRSTTRRRGRRWCRVKLSFDLMQIKCHCMSQYHFFFFLIVGTVIIQEEKKLNLVWCPFPCRFRSIVKGNWHLSFLSLSKHTFLFDHRVVRLILYYYYLLWMYVN